MFSLLFEYFIKFYFCVYINLRVTGIKMLCTVVEENMMTNNKALIIFPLIIRSVIWQLYHLFGLAQTYA